jgi:PAS domain S-box-containing protein
MTPPVGGTVELERSLLRGSHRAAQSQPPLIRGGVSESRDGPPIEVPLPLAEIESHETINVLHVDDSPEIGELSREFLTRVDDHFEVTAVSTVVEALTLLKRERVDCIVSDYEMPNTDGLEFLELVRERHPDLPFILFTAKGDEGIASEAIAAGVTDYMEKHIDQETYEVLAHRIENAVEQYRTQQQFWNALSWYQRLAEQEIAGVFIVQEGSFVYVNRKLADTFGRDQEALVGETPLSIVAERDHEDVSFLLDRDVEVNDTLQVEFTGTNADGDTFDVEVQCGAIEYDDDPALIGVLQDVSDD